MKQKDLSEKMLMRYNDVFADLVNVLLFDGRAVISPKNLIDAPVIESFEQGGDLYWVESDVGKFWVGKNNSILARLNIENENTLKNRKHMPVRKLMYDGASYSYMRNNHQEYPVVTICLNFHPSGWNTPKSLKHTLPVPKELEQYVNEYEVTVFDIRHLDDRILNEFTSDFKSVAHYLVKGYTGFKQELEHPKEVIKLVETVRPGTFTETLHKKLGKGKYDLPRLLSEEEAARHESKGRAEGRAEGREEGRAKERIETNAMAVVNLMESLNIKRKQAMDLLRIDEQERKKVSARVTKILKERSGKQEK